MKRLPTFFVTLTLALAGCGDGDGPATVLDDAGGDDAGARDAAVPVDSASPSEAGRPDDASSSPRDAGGGSGDAGSPDAGPGAGCPLAPACDATPPATDPIESWRHTVATPLVVATGAPRHRGRDLYLRPTDPQWALAKFAYGAGDSDLHDEDVDVWLARDCATWELLGRATTTNDGDHATVEGVVDSGGWAFFPIPDTARLGVGRHRIHFVVRGDHTTAEQYVEVLAATARFVVTDMDGTLTTTESAAFTSLLTGAPPDANAGAAAALTALARRGYRIFYLTARPEWLEAKSHEWIALRGFPPGNVHTTLTLTGALGAAAETFKTDELAALQTRFPAGVEWAIGNTATDIGAYATSAVAVDHVLSYMFDPGPRGTRFDDYTALVARFDALTAVCR